MAWISTKQAAELEQVSERTMRRNKENFVFRPVSGVGGTKGTQYEFDLDSLSDLAQARYRGEQEARSTEVLRSLTDAQRDIVFEKIAAVEAYKDFKTMYPLADKLQAFLAQYNEQHSDNPITKRQLNTWESQFNQDGVAGLVDRRGGHNKGQYTIQEDEAKVFLALR